MDRQGHGRLAALVVLVAGLAALASAAGVFLRGNLATIDFVTPRGDRVDLLVDGVYRWNSRAIAAEGVGWDYVTLFLVVPAILVCVPWLIRGSLRASLALTGLLAYLLYQYFEYAVFLTYGPLFPVYVAIVALSLSALALVLAGLPWSTLERRFGSGFPRRGATLFGSYMAILLAGMWIPLVARTMNAQSVPALAGAPTMTVQAFDLGLLVPLGIFTAVTVHRRMVAGFVLAAVTAVKGASMGAAIFAMLTFEGIATGEFQAPPMVVFAVTALVSVVLAFRVLHSAAAETPATHAARPMAHPAPAA